jgi:di/tricarboxylate transporter
MRARTQSALNLAIPLLGAAIFFTPAPEGLAPVVMHAAGLVVFTVGLWATQSLPEHVTGLLFLLAAVLTEVAPAHVVFSGFTSGTLWLVLGGLIIAEAVRSTALGERLAFALLGRFVGSYRKLVIGTVLVATLLCFVMPATLGRVLLLVPIASGLAQRVGFERGSTGHTGLMLAAMVATFQIGTGILPANAPNLALAGAAESVYGVHLIYGEYLLVQFPVLGLLKMALIVWITCWIFPAHIGSAAAANRAEPMRPEERRLALILGIALALWASDFVHGIRPGWVALGAGLAAILPRIGVMPMAVFNDSIKFGPYFYIGAVGYSNIVLPYAVPPLVVGLQVAGIGFRAAARYTLALAAPSFFLLVPLNYLWWKAIGYFG